MGVLLMASCQLCDLERDQCQHGLQDRRLAEAQRAIVLWVSPSRTAHFPDCPHKRGDDDLSRWGEITTPQAWNRLGNGEHLPSTGGARPELVAVDRCMHCVEHGPW